MRFFLPPLAVACVAACAFPSLPAHAQFTVASDSFELADHPTGDRAVVAGASQAIRFFTRNAVTGTYTPAIVNDAVFGSNVLAHVDTTNPGNGGHQIIGLLPEPITLLAEGDFIRLEFTFRYTNIATATPNAAGFRFGLEGANGTFVTGDGQPATSDNDQGYYAVTGVGTTPPGNVASNATIWRENGGTLPILGGIDRAGIVTNTVGAAFNDTALHTASFLITRGTGSNLAFSLTYDGGAAITGTTSTSPYYTFDEVAFGNGFVTSPVSFHVDNVVVTSSVPEPGSTALLLLAAGWMASFRRRRADSVCPK